MRIGSKMNAKTVSMIRVPGTPYSNDLSKDYILVIHLLGSKDKRAIRSGFTILKDTRFLTNDNEHWLMRIELEPIYDKKIRTKNYIVTRNEYEKNISYFLNRTKKAGLIHDNYQQILDANKDGL